MCVFKPFDVNQVELYHAYIYREIGSLSTASNMELDSLV
jgi:hypothetical protein